METRIKNWEEQFDEYTLDEYGGWDVSHIAVKQFISSLLEQERKDERQRVIDEIFEVILNYKNEDSALTLNKLCTKIITKLNQLKEE